jgi:DNA adenine methylase
MTPGLLKWPGGKAYLAQRIVHEFGHWSQFSCYCEPFLGGGSVLLAAPFFAVHHASDLNEGLIALWQEVQEQRPEFLAVVKAQEYTQATFDWWKTFVPDGRLELAMKCLVTHRFSRGGQGGTFAWSERLRGGQPGDVNAWQNFVARLPAIGASVRGVHFEVKNAVQAIIDVDSPATLFYLDPPYVHETRVSKDLYTHEMNLRQHEELVDLIRGLTGKCVVSGYSHPLYESLGWRRVTWDMPNNQAQTATKSRREECLWINR